MQIPDTGDIVTPIDDPCQFDPAWRSSVAQYLFCCGVRTCDDLDSIIRFGGPTVILGERNSKSKKTSKKKIKPASVVRTIYPFGDSQEYRCFAADPWIRGMIFMLDAKSRGYPSTKDDAPIRLATRWYEEMDNEAAMKKKLEPMLLTGIDMDTLTLDLAGNPSARPVFEAYERLFFNCRDENWDLNKSSQLIMRMAMPYGPLKTYLRKWEMLDEDGFVIGDGRPLAKDSDVWKAIAATMGYEALMYSWKSEKYAHGMKQNSLEHVIELSWKVATSRLFNALFTGEIAHEDAARILSAYTAQAKKISDDRNGASGNEDGDTTKALLEILRITSPKMVTLSDSDQKAKNEEIESRLASQMAINKTAIQDKGAQVNAEVMNSQISNAILT